MIEGMLVMNEMKIYQIVHSYDVDGGYGDAVHCEEVIWSTTDKDLADAYVEKWNDPYIYDTPYDWLEKNRLTVREVTIGAFDVDVPPPETSHYYVRASVDPVTHKIRKRRWEEQRQRVLRNAQVDAWKRDAEAAGCTFTPAY